MMIRNRKKFHDLFKIQKFEGYAAEIGVREGYYSEYLNKQNFKKVFSIDTWDSSTEKQLSEKEINNNYISAKKRLKNFDTSVILKMNAMDAAFIFNDNIFDFIYDDATAANINFIKLWWDKLKIGGVFAGRDYAYLGNKKIIPKEDYLNTKKWSKCGTIIKNTLKNLKINAEIFYTQEEFPSWFCFKQNHNKLYI